MYNQQQLPKRFPTDTPIIFLKIVGPIKNCVCHLTFFLFKHFPMYILALSKTTIVANLKVKTWLNVLKHDCHVIIAIRSRLFVPEAQGVHQFVLNYAVPLAPGADRDVLFPAAPPYVRPGEHME